MESSVPFNSLLECTVSFNSPPSPLTVSWSALSALTVSWSLLLVSPLCLLESTVSVTLNSLVESTITFNSLLESTVSVTFNSLCFFGNKKQNLAKLSKIIRTASNEALCMRVCVCCVCVCVVFVCKLGCVRAMWWLFQQQLFVPVIDTVC